MTNTTRTLFHWLETLGSLGSQGKNSLKYAEVVLKNLREGLQKHEFLNTSSFGNTSDEKDINLAVETWVTTLLSNADDAAKSDVRVVCSCYVLAIILEIQNIMNDVLSIQKVHKCEEAQKIQTEKPPVSPCLISVQQTKIIEDALHVVTYTIVLGCLSQETSQYVKLMMTRNHFALGQNLVVISHSCRHSLLCSIMKTLMDLMENSSLGAPLQGSLFPEVLSALLELCFAPGKVKDQPEDTGFFRQCLERVLDGMDYSHVVQHLLMIKGIAKNGGWLQKVCGSFIVRRYMMRPNGVAVVIGVGLSICQGQDYKRFEAIAALISQAKFPDMDLFYSTIGPQVSELMLKDDLKPEILYVVMLVVSDLAQRSATLTALHVTKDLLEPLVNLTSESTTSCNANLSLSCVTQINKLFVEIGLPNASLMGLLRPIIDPLMAIAAFPASHLKSKSQQCIVRYLSQQSNEEAIQILLDTSKVYPTSSIPMMSPSVVFNLDEDGGIKISSEETPCRKSVLESDEDLAKTIVSILETLENPTLVRMFYERLVSLIDFTVLNEVKISPTTLMTDEDIQSHQYVYVRRVFMSCSLLSNLADSEKLTNDLFQNLSAALPIVDTLLRTSCQSCDNESLEQTKLSFLLNVVMMVSCYVNEQMTRKKMSSDDWRGLKLLLPTLDEIKENISDQAVLLFVEQLRNLVLTHGVVSDPVSGVRNEKENKQEKPSHKSNMVSELDENVQKEQSKSVTELSNKNTERTHPCSSKANEKDDCQKSSYSEAMTDLLSPLLPIRGHGLLSLSKLIEERDAETVTHKEQLLALFHHNLKEEDSYLYLMAIRGLAALCDIYPEKVTETLTREFSVANRSTEDRAKLAETLARASMRLGSILPHYSSPFLNSLLTGVRDPEAIVRASSLSSLGEVCKTLRFSLGPIIYEIFGVLQNVIEVEKEVEVRRAAVLVVTSILQGLGHDAFSVLKDLMRDLYRVLRLVHARDADDVVRLHCQMAMDEIDTITKQFLLPKLNLTKRIYVADLPPNHF